MPLSLRGLKRLWPTADTATLIRLCGKSRSRTRRTASRAGRRTEQIGDQRPVGKLSAASMMAFKCRQAARRMRQARGGRSSLSRLSTSTMLGVGGRPDGLVESDDGLVTTSRQECWCRRPCSGASQAESSASWSTSSC
jgi:hypothetical protein